MFAVATAGSAANPLKTGKIVTEEEGREGGRGREEGRREEGVGREGAWEEERKGWEVEKVKK